MFHVKQNKGYNIEKQMVKLAETGLVGYYYNGKKYYYFIKQVKEYGGRTQKADCQFMLTNWKTVNVSVKAKKGYDKAERCGIINCQNRKNLEKLLLELFGKEEGMEVLGKIDKFMQSGKPAIMLTELLDFDKAYKLAEYYSFYGTATTNDKRFHADIILQVGEKITCYDKSNFHELVNKLRIETRAGRARTDFSMEWNGNRVINCRFTQ